MSHTRGLPRTRPLWSRAELGMRNSFPASVVRVLLLLAAFGAATAGARASLYITNDPADVNPTESVYVTGINPTWEGVTPAGVRYRITQNEGEQLYSDHYSTGLGAARCTLRIEFDRPIAAIGAQLMVAGFGPSDSSIDYQSNSPFAYVRESGYYGLVANTSGFRETTYVSASGPISLSRMDVRPMPVAKQDSLTTYENFQHAFDAPYILSNDFQADGAVLAAAPLHADFFQLNADGSFIYRPSRNYQGIDSFLYRATNGNGAAASEPATVTLQVMPVNCPPTFTEGANIACPEDDGLQTIGGWATSMASGPTNEPSQSLDWLITTNNDSLFAVMPTIDDQGNLSFQPRLHENGVAQVTVRLHDNGGNDNGGVDVSEAKTFTVTVAPKEHAPMLEAIPDSVIRQGDALVLRMRVSEVDCGTPILYSLDQAPVGASIDEVSGQVVWRPSENLSGKLFPFIIRATETGSNEFSTTTSFQVEVLPTASAPEIASIPDIQTYANADVRFKVSSGTAGARFFLASKVAGAVLDPNSGEFNWKPTEKDAGSDYRFEVSVVDFSKSNLCTVRAFSVRVARQIISKPNNVRYIGRSHGLQTTGEAAMQFKAVGKAKTRP